MNCRSCRGIVKKIPVYTLIALCCSSQPSSVRIEALLLVKLPHSRSFSICCIFCSEFVLWKEYGAPTGFRSLRARSHSFVPGSMKQGTITKRGDQSVRRGSEVFYLLKMYQLLRFRLHECGTKVDNLAVKTNE